MKEWTHFSCEGINPSCKVLILIKFRGENSSLKLKMLIQYCCNKNHHLSQKMIYSTNCHTCKSNQFQNGNKIINAFCKMNNIFIKFFFTVALQKIREAPETQTRDVPNHKKHRRVQYTVYQYYMQRN